MSTARTSHDTLPSLFLLRFLIQYIIDSLLLCATVILRL